MKDETLIGKKVMICAYKDPLFGIKGIIKKHDGEYFFVMLCGVPEITIPFTRDEIRVCREEK